MIKQQHRVFGLQVFFSLKQRQLELPHIPTRGASFVLYLMMRCIFTTIPNFWLHIKRKVTNFCASWLRLRPPSSTHSPSPAAPKAVKQPLSSQPDPVLSNMTIWYKGGLPRYSFSPNGSKNYFLQKRCLKKRFLLDTNLDQLTSEQSGTHNFKSFARIEM